MQGQGYGSPSGFVSNPNREFDAYYSSVFGFPKLPAIDNAAQQRQLVNWLEDNWNLMSTSEKSEINNQSKYNKAKRFFPTICKG
ncbi:MAG: hypothetical protein ACJA1H_000237 [Glaciecola sp.]|jgi:hypothetical protein